MVYYRKAKKEGNEYKTLIEHQRLLHYEDLLIRKIDKLEERYKAGVDSNKILFFISLLISVLGYSNDVIGIKIIKNIPNYKEVMLRSIFLLSTIMWLRSLIKFFKFNKRIRVYNMKTEYGQDMLFYKYIVEKVKEDEDLYKKLNNSVDKSSNFNTKIFEYYWVLNNKDKIVFSKSDLKFFIYEYVSKLDKNICNELHNYLYEVIISRHIIRGDLRKDNIKDEFTFTINKNNLISIQFLPTQK
ncbi:hypothetical protein [Hathewaya massiliensis]|uniref:hypothetical protein n=1 Tax=Hathewaya massiliensis TaxID=1964382 RepID=UPI0011579984|nr:hypothetical protein [Hathewaya massiliensis]